MTSILADERTSNLIRINQESTISANSDLA